MDIDYHSEIAVFERHECYLLRVENPVPVDEFNLLGITEAVIKGRREIQGMRADSDVMGPSEFSRLYEMQREQDARELLAKKFEQEVKVFAFRRELDDIPTASTD